MTWPSLKNEDGLVLWMLLPLYLTLSPFYWGYLLTLTIAYSLISNSWRERKSLIVIIGLSVGIGLLLLTSMPIMRGENILATTALVAVLKRYESHGVRGIQTLIFVVFITSALNLIYWNSLIALAHLLILMWLILRCYQQLQVSLNSDSGEPTASKKSKNSSVLELFAWSLPLAVIFFLFLPRINGPLWDLGLAFGLPLSVFEKMQGVSPLESLDGEKQSPENNTIQRMRQQQKIILIAEFSNSPPEGKNLYWRGPVYLGKKSGKWVTTTYNTGRTQRLKDAYRNKTEYQDAINHTNQAIQYKVKLAASSKIWLFALDTPMHNAQESYISKDLQLLSIRSVKDEFQYEISSFLDGHFMDSSKYHYPDNLDPVDEEATDLADIIQTMTPQQAADLKSKSIGASKESYIISNTLKFLQQAPQIPTLATFRQYILKKNINSQAISGVIVQALQQAGLPARLVGGYQGGDGVAFTDIIVVREKHLHYWLEVWTQESGWSRMDPKSLLSNPKNKQEIQQSLASISPIAQKKITNHTTIIDPPNTSFLQKVELWLLSYAPEVKTAVRKGNAGNPSPTIPLWLIFAAATLLWAAFFILFRFYRNKTPLLQMSWNRLTKHLAKQGYHLQSWQCPSHLKDLIAKESPKWQPTAFDLINCYLVLTYQSKPSHAAIKLFSKQNSDFINNQFREGNHEYI